MRCGLRGLLVALFLGALTACGKTPEPPGIYHVVLLRFAPHVTPKEIEALFRGVDELKQVIPGLEAVHVGTNESQEALGQGYTHGFIIHFKSPHARNLYLNDSEHKRVSSELLNLLEDSGTDVLVFDLPVQN